MSSGDLPLVVRFWMKASMGVAGVMVAVVVTEGSEISVFLTCWCYAKTTTVGLSFSEGGTHEETLRPQRNH